MAAVGPRNETDETRIGSMAQRLVVEAYQFGIRDRGVRAAREQRAGLIAQKLVCTAFGGLERCRVCSLPACCSADDAHAMPH